MAYRWITDLYALQPEDAGTRFYTFRQGPALVEQPSSDIQWLAITDFSLPRQTYYTPGMAAVFLCGYGQRFGVPQAINLAFELLAKNLEGCAEQYEDLASVQLCKFGWAAAVLTAVDNSRDWIPHVVRMVDWFAARQADDGSWAPSTFLQPAPGKIDRLIKTAEHVMEMNSMLAALGAANPLKNKS